MVQLHDFIKISDYEWELPVTYREDMRVPVRVFATQGILESGLSDDSLQQAINSATLPGLVGQVMVMPDMHQGYGFPIGGVAATVFPQGVISPGGIGYDINCGVRLLASQIEFESVSDLIDPLATAINHYCPSGVGVKGQIRMTDKELEEVCRQGSSWALRKGYASREDVELTESQGKLEGADPDMVSKRARERGREQMGTLGAGNHFIEVDIIEQVFDQQAAQVMSIYEGKLALQIHCGSRGFGHQVCTDYVKELQSAVRRYGIQLPDRELVCAPLDSQEGQAYLKAMRCAANYAFANRQTLAHFARRAFEEVLAGRVSDWQLRQVYDIAHNMGNIETHEIDGQPLKVCVHRKGATRAFGPGATGLPDRYSSIGQPVLVPGSMGTCSWVLAATEESMKRSFGSSCHGAGRLMSRAQAKKSIRGETLKTQLQQQGIIIRSRSLSGLAEEAPQAYKDVDEVIETVVGAGIARKVARLTPILVVKG